MVRTKYERKKINKTSSRSFSSRKSSNLISSSSTASSSSPTILITSSSTDSITDTVISSNKLIIHDNSTNTYIKHWKDMIHNCVDWMKNKIISTLDMVLYQNMNRTLEYETILHSKSLLELQSPSPFHNLPIDVIAGTLIRFLPMSDVMNLKLCNRSCAELFEVAARNSSLLLLHCRPIHVGPYTNRCQYSLPSEANSSYLPILWSLRHFISLISKQTQTVNYQYMSCHQSVYVLGPGQYLDEQMRSSVIDWMIEVSVEFKFAPSILHYSVLVLDQVLSHVAVPRKFFQLLGCVCLYIVSRPTNNAITMDLDDVMYMCDSQYSLEEVNNMIEFIERHLDPHSHRILVASLAQHTHISISSLLSTAPQHSSNQTSNSDNGNVSSFPIYSPHLVVSSFQITLNSPTMIHFLASICNALHLPLVMYQCIEINAAIYNTAGGSPTDPTPTPSTAEHILLSIFLADLSLLDYQMLQYSPFTIACAVVCLTRLTLFYYGQSQILLTPYGLADGRSREIKQLLKNEEHRLYIQPDPEYLTKPFGLVWFEKFLLQSSIESFSIRACIERLWLLHADYIGYIYNSNESSPYTPYIIHHHSHIFAGLREKYAPANSHRDSIWQKLQTLPKELLTQYLDQIFSQYPGTVL